MSLPGNSSISGDGRPISDDDLSQIHSALRGLRFGSVQIIVQDGVIVQIDRTEKRRMRHSPGSAK